MCEFAYKDNRFQFLLCKKMGDATPENVQTAAQRMCAFQKYCALERRYKTTESSNNCKLRREE